MKRIILVFGIPVLVFLSLIIVALASESTVLSALQGEFQYGGSLVLKGSGWKNAPENPQTVYIDVLTPNVKLTEAIRSALTNVTRAHGLNLVYVNEPLTDHDLKGRIVVVYLPQGF